MGIYNSNNDGMGNVIQEFPLKPGAVDVTAGAANIDLQDSGAILILTSCTAYVEGESTKTFAITAPAKFGVSGIDSIHVDKVVSYILA